MLPDEINSDYNDMHAWISADEKILLFVSDTRPDSFGHDDLYVSYNRSGRWTPAKNLGPQINTRFYEYSAKISPDGKYLFYCHGFGDVRLPDKRVSTGMMIRLKSLVCLVLASLPAFAQDWPQWGGPQRDFKINSTGLPTRWPASGPRRLWNRILGDGYSAIVTDSGRLYTMYRKGEQEVVIALDAGTGKTIWEHRHAAPYLRGMDMSYGDGPHATPLIAGELLYAAGSTGKLLCLEKATGKLRWSHELWQGFTGGTHMGYSSSPLAYKNTLIMQADGAGRSLMAFDLNSGRVVWQALNFRISNSSPIIINVDGQEQLVVYTHKEILGADPNDGALLWAHRIAAQWNFHFNISTPVWGPGNLLFASSAYGIGGRVLHLSRRGDRTIVKELWRSERTRIHKENAIRLGDVIYASTGHLGPAFFTAMDVKTGNVLWQDRRFSHANAIYADGKFIILDEDGILGLATPTARGLIVHARVEIFTSRSWTAPTLVGRTLYLRNREKIMALQLSMIPQ